MIKRNITFILLYLLIPCFLMGQEIRVNIQHKIITTDQQEYLPQLYDKSVKMHKSMLGSPVGESIGLTTNWDYFSNSIIRNQIVYWHGVKFANMVRPYGTGSATVRHIVYTERDSATGVYNHIDVFADNDYLGWPDIDVGRTGTNVGKIGVVGHVPCILGILNGSTFTCTTFAPFDDPSFQFSGPNIWLANSGKLYRDKFQFYQSPNGVTFTNWDSISAFSPTPLFWAHNGSVEVGISKSPNEQNLVYYGASYGIANSVYPVGSKKAYNGVQLDSCDQVWTIFSTNSGTSWTGKRIEADGITGLITTYPNYAPNISNFGQIDLAVTNAGVVHTVANGYSVSFNATDTTFMFPVIYYNSETDKWITISNHAIDTMQILGATASPTLPGYPGNSIGNAYPSVSVSEDGKFVYVCWTGPQMTGNQVDTVSDAGIKYFREDLYHTWSTDGGLTWSAPAVLSGDKNTSECFGHTPQYLRYDPVQHRYVADIVYLADLAPGSTVINSSVATDNPIMYYAFTIPVEVNFPLVDGDISDPQYVTAAVKQNSNSGFGSAIDVSKIVYYPDAANGQLYIGIQCKVDNTNGNGIGLMIGLSELAGVPAGTSLGGSPGGHYMGGNGGSNPNFKADFPVSYMLALNPGGGSNCYVDAVKLVGTRAGSYLGNGLQTGTPVNGPSGASEFWAQNSVTFAYDNSGAANKGFEIKIPFSQLGVTNAGNIQLFAFVVSGSAYFADVTVPGNVTTGNPGFDADFSTLSGGPFHSTLAPLPVELTSLTAQLIGNSVVLNWSTATELKNYGFEIERRINPGTWGKIGFIHGAGNSNSANNYSFTDADLTEAGKYSYRLKQVDNNGSFTFSEIIEINYLVPANFSLSQNYPNPFNPSTIIKYSLPKPSNVKLLVYNTLGKTVKILENGFKNAGYYSINFSAPELPSGIYFYKLEAGQFSEIKKMMLLK